MSATNVLPLFHLYGDPPDGQAFDFIHIETIVARSSVNDWVIRAHRHRNLFQILLIAEGGGEMAFEAMNARFSAPVAIASDVAIGRMAMRAFPGPPASSTKWRTSSSGWAPPPTINNVPLIAPGRSLVVRVVCAAAREGARDMPRASATSATFMRLFNVILGARSICFAGEYAAWRRRVGARRGSRRGRALA